MSIAVGRVKSGACLSRLAVALAIGLAATAATVALAQDSEGGGGGDAAPSAPNLYSAPTDATPYIFSPNVYAPPDPATVVQSLNTPSGLSPFLTSTGAVPRGLRYNIDEALRYDDNVRRLPKGVAPPAGRSRGDFYSVTNIGGSASTQVGLQTFFIRGFYGFTRYNSNDDLNNNRYSLSGGVNWRLGSPCAGSLVASTNRSEIEIQNLAVGQTTSLTTTDRIDLSGRCRLFDRFYGTFGAGASRYTVESSPLNDYRQLSARAGLEYAVPRLYTVGVEAVYLKNDFVNRTSSILNLQTTELQQQIYRAYYNYIVSPKTTVSLAAGATSFTSSSQFGSNERTLPTYSASINYRATPKITLIASTQYSVGPPQDVLADYQRSQVTSASLIYTYSRKLSVSLAYARARTTSSSFSPFLGTLVTQGTRSNTASIDANYRITPFLFGGLGYRFNERSDTVTGLKSNSNVYTVSLSYRR